MKMPTVPSAPAMPSADEALCDLAERLSRVQEAGIGGHAGDGDEPGQHLESLLTKLRENQFVLAFCGHFSAGKSTLINRLAGSRILPSSPIPTSANQVMICHGEPGAVVHLASGEDLNLPFADFDRLGGLCAEGDLVRSVEIRHPLAHVPESVWLMDTPGIDSTDDAHRTVTESALYLADAVFYVMDYNHVQSEVNLQFTRTLSEWGKPLYLIVNQVDKHVELELPFEEFRQSVTAAFASWNVYPEGLFFTSMADPDHPQNQWDDLLAAIQRLGHHRESLLFSGVWHSAAHLAEMELRQMEQAEAPEREQLQAKLAAGGTDPQARANALAASLEDLASAAPAALQELNRQAGAILANAPIFPHGTKELAREYLEARRPGFRVGFFGAESKTRAEVDRRLTALHADLSEKVTAHIHWHLQELLQRFGEAQTGRDEAYEAAVREFAVPLEPEMLAKLVNETSLVAREYQFKYIADITADITLRYRLAMRPLLDRAGELARTAAEGLAAPIKAELQALSGAVSAAARLADMAAATESRREALAAILGPEPAAWTGAEETPEAGQPCQSESRGKAAYAGLEAAAVWSDPAAGAGSAAADSPSLATAAGSQAAVPTAGSEAAVPDAGSPAAGQSRRLRQRTAARLQDAARLLAPLPGMAHTAKNLDQRADRLLDAQFTVALFGAFSAGKSSFANALMGINLLPSSPNPTTAVITRIAPPTDDRPHGHVHVVWKSPEQLRREVDRALDALELPATRDLAADLLTGARHSQSASSLLAKPHAVFLAAATKGYAAVRDRLGSAESVDLAEFKALVASEERSCFVEEITVSVDCPVTRQGITLIDTPGADSINARHTDVAFDYIKNADAILFVTYYNHAFSRADHEFLIQLGRVKDAFALDKLFFVVNAADLAHDAAELGVVTAHVRKNLQACGIREARIFPVSSQTALWSRLQAAGKLPHSLAARLQARVGVPAPTPEQGLRAAGMEQFEDEFYRFVVTDLSQMAVDAALSEVQRASETIADWLEAARADEGARTARLQALQAARRQAAEALAALDAGPEASEVVREIDELLYYARWRVLKERYSGAFGEAFTSSTLRSDSPDLKRALRAALHEVTEFIAFDLSQEMRATALRVENAVNRQAERVQARGVTAVRQHLPNCAAPAFTPVRSAVPAFSDGREALDPEPMHKLLSLFKSPEHFFTGGGRNQLKAELEKALQGPVGTYLAAARTLLADWYGGAFERQVAAIRDELGGAVDAQVDGLTAALTGTGETERLAAVLGRLTAGQATPAI